MFGAHLSIAGGIHQALLQAQRLDMDCVQLFTKNQRQWKAPPLRSEEVRRWATTVEETGLQRTVSHDSYLINLASPDETTYRRSFDLFREELVRCEKLGIPDLVMHPGAHRGDGEEVGLRRVADAIDRIHAELSGYRTRTCLELTAGQGTNLGHTLDHLRRILDMVTEPERFSICIDTAHAIAAGYALTTAAGARGFLDEVDDRIGSGRVAVVHVNDSKVPRGRRVDRHEHIGHGYIPRSVFAALVHDPRLKEVPKILETPKGTAADGRSWDAVNLETLRRLRRPKRAS